MSENNSGSVFTMIGAAAATYLSWMKWHSVGYAILHALCGWVYVVYYAIKYGIKF